ISWGGSNIAARREIGIAIHHSAINDRSPVKQSVEIATLKRLKLRYTRRGRVDEIHLCKIDAKLLCCECEQDHDVGARGTADALAFQVLPRTQLYALPHDKILASDGSAGDDLHVGNLLFSHDGRTLIAQRRDFDPTALHCTLHIGIGRGGAYLDAQTIFLAERIEAPQRNGASGPGGRHADQLAILRMRLACS